MDQATDAGIQHQEVTGTGSGFAPTVTAKDAVPTWRVTDTDTARNTTADTTGLTATFGVQWAPQRSTARPDQAPSERLRAGQLGQGLSASAEGDRAQPQVGAGLQPAAALVIDRCLKNAVNRALDAAYQPRKFDFSWADDVTAAEDSAAALRRARREARDAYYASLAQTKTDEDWDNLLSPPVATVASTVAQHHVPAASTGAVPRRRPWTADQITRTEVMARSLAATTSSDTTLLPPAVFADNDYRMVRPDVDAKLYADLSSDVFADAEDDRTAPLVPALAQQPQPQQPLQQPPQQQQPLAAVLAAVPAAALEPVAGNVAAQVLVDIVSDSIVDDLVNGYDVGDGGVSRNC